MKVITHGKFGARRHRCVGCDCVFEYTTDDIHQRESKNGLDWETYVLCPECGRPAPATPRRG